MRRLQILNRRKSLRKKTGPWLKGWEDGYKQGWDYSYHLGQCKSIVDGSQTDSGIQWNIKVLFVQAQGAPYASLDQGISEGLRGLVREAVIAGAGQDAVQLARETSPDLVLVLDALGTHFTIAQADELRSMGIQTAVWFPDDPYHTDTTVHIASHYDYVFTMELNCVPLYAELGCPRVHYLPAGITPSCIRPDAVEPAYKSDICFIGSAYWNRVALFDQIAPYLSNKKVKIIGYWWERLTHYALLANKIHGYWLTAEETIKHYNGARIVINLHRSVDDPSHNSNSRNIPARSVNPRLFEISACGTLQLTDMREELPNLYEPEAEISSFSTADDLTRKMDYFLSHETHRRDIALRGLRRTMRDHTYRKRLNQMLQIIIQGG